MRLSLRLDSKARGGRILYCIRLTSNAASEDAAASEWQVYFDRGPYYLNFGFLGFTLNDRMDSFKRKKIVRRQ